MTGLPTPQPCLRHRLIIDSFSINNPDDVSRLKEITPRVCDEDITEDRLKKHENTF